jgi:hypothetical protein
MDETKRIETAIAWVGYSVVFLGLLAILLSLFLLLPLSRDARYLDNAITDGCSSRLLRVVAALVNHCRCQRPRLPPWGWASRRSFLFFTARNAVTNPTDRSAAPPNTWFTSDVVMPLYKIETPERVQITATPMPRFPSRFPPIPFRRCSWAKAQFEKTSPATWFRWYRTNLSTLKNHAALAERELDKITSENVADFAADRQTKGLQPSSVNRSIGLFKCSGAFFA